MHFLTNWEAVLPWWCQTPNKALSPATLKATYLKHAFVYISITTIVPYSRPLKCNIKGPFSFIFRKFYSLRLCLRSLLALLSQEKREGVLYCGAILSWEFCNIIGEMDGLKKRDLTQTSTGIGHVYRRPLPCNIDSQRVRGWLFGYNVS